MTLLSVVIPAHHEERTLPRLLRRLIAEDPAGDLELIVVANGCTDRTAEVARAAGERVRVVEISTGNKVAALNAGDAVATVYPRAYVDADTDVSAAALRSLASALSEPGVRRTAAPRLVVDTRGASLGSRLYHQIWVRTPYVRSGPIGCGVYALSERAHEVFGEFPAVIADDLFVDRQAGPDRWIDEGHTFTFVAPRTLSALISRLTRATLGNLQLEAEYGLTAGTGPPRELITHVAIRPWLWPGFGVYLGVRVAVQRRARRRLAAGEYHWSRDESTRH